MKTKVYTGRLMTDDYNFLCLKNENCSPIALTVSGDWTNGEKVFIRYYISENPMTLEQATEALMVKTLGGQMQADYILDAYSEYTILEWEEDFQIGGHNIIDELATYEGKYLILVIEEK